MTPLERLYAEQWPTGTFGHAQPAPKPPARPIRPWSPEEQAEHVAQLAAALDETESRGTGQPECHLHAVDAA
ncbi:hypothetical protein ACFWY6_12775 [Streptomyces sp. NPDC059037]|uniref:hypothetical protein n=1 Tax=Streptomyces sp. NPDC059037 TaxID=3346710 RepID=UPI0036BC248E